MTRESSQGREEIEDNLKGALKKKESGALSLGLVASSSVGFCKHEHPRLCVIRRHLVSA